MADCGCSSASPCGGESDGTILIRQGVDQSFGWPVIDRETGEPFDMTGWTVEMNAANRPGGTSRGSWSTPDDFTFQEVDGAFYVVWSLSAAESAAITWPQAVYEIRVISPTNEGPFFFRSGTLEVIPSV